MKAILLRGLAAFSVCGLVAAGQVAVAAVPDETSTGCTAYGGAIRTFTKRVENYAALHRRLAHLLPVIEGKADYGSTWMSRAALAAALREARHGAQQGEIFGGTVEEAFLCLLDRGERNAEGWLALSGGKHPPFLYPDHPRVNESYYSADVLAVPELASWLPRLPEELEYVVIGSDLVVWDIYADLVVDYLPDAFLDDEGYW
jgi:hypothetical protein